MSNAKIAMDYSNEFPVSTAGKDNQDSLVSYNAATNKGKKRQKTDKKKKIVPSREAQPLCATISIQDIPNNILNLIFSFLDVRERLRIELVCRKWRLIGNLLPWLNPSLLKFTPKIRNSSLRIPSNELTDHILLALLSRCGACLKEIEISYQPIDYVIITSRSLSMIGEWCPNLEKLKLCGVPVDGGTLKTIASGCHKLKDFYLNAPRNSDFWDGILSIIEHCKSLEAVDLSHVLLTDDWFKVVNPKIKKVELSVCSISPSTPLQNLIACCDSLEVLTFIFDGDLCIDEVKRLFNIFNHFKITLKKLQVDGGLPMYVNWCDGLKNLHHLEELTLRDSHSVDDKLITCIVKECPNLECLQIPGCVVTDQGAASLEALPLKTLHVASTLIISDKGLGFICKKGMLVKCNLSFMPFITEDFCCSLAKTCPKLCEFDVSANGKRITNRVVNAFRFAIQRKFLQPPVKLIVGCTKVSTRVKRCAGLEVKFTTDYEENVKRIMTSKSSHFLQEKFATD